MTRKLIKTWVFIALAIMSFGVYAGCCYQRPYVGYCCQNTYVGNPNRPYTVWVPGYCRGKCYVPGRYVKFINPPVTCCHVKWRCNRWVPYNVVLLGDTNSGL